LLGALFYSDPAPIPSERGHPSIDTPENLDICPTLLARRRLIGPAAMLASSRRPQPWKNLGVMNKR
jgi:hypothetical protein